MKELGGNPGRASHRLSIASGREVYACRTAAAKMFGALPENVIFTYNATYALNMAIKTSYHGGGIIISDLEHNSVRRPALALTSDVRVFDSCVELSGEKRTLKILESIKRLLRGADMLCCTAASNICSATLPIREIGALCKNAGVRFIVDGAQAGGIYPLDLARDNIDILCLPGHKGLYGPGGSGMMLLGEGVLPEPFIHGGSGVNSLDASMPELPPERYEGGTLSVPVIAGLRAGMEFVSGKGIDAIRAHETALAARFSRGLGQLGSRVRIFAPECCADGSIVLFRLSSQDPEETASLLDERGICVRGGYHCAPLAHERLSTGAGGAVRASFSVFNTAAEVERALAAIAGLI